MSMRVIEHPLVPRGFELLPLTERGYLEALEDLALLWENLPEADEGRTFAAQIAAQETGLVNHFGAR